MSQNAVLDRNTMQANETVVSQPGSVREPQVGVNLDHLTLLDWSRVDTMPTTALLTSRRQSRNWPKVDVFDASMILLVASSGIAGLVALLHLG